MKIIKIAETYSIEIISKLRSIFDETIDIHSLANGTRGVFRYQDGRTYKVIVRPIEIKKAE